MTANDKIRCFVSLDLSDEIIRYAKSIQNNLISQNLFQGKYTKPTNIHLTLKFLGELPPQKIDEVNDLLQQVKFTPFNITISDLGVFSRRHIRIIWLKVSGADQLQKQIDTALQGHFHPEERFMGHITIVRVKKAFDKNLLLDYLDNYTITPKEILVSEFRLKQSILTPEGPIYKTIETFKKS
ncbi:MAG: RNA 2',3'-cyclic phosphodiesterase [Salinivirgaceae bacterium]|nr:MAG: RNA 2',3'-cyclic phosphodiesterase [Salinivirgaceae bacterium]